MSPETASNTPVSTESSSAEPVSAAGILAAARSGNPALAADLLSRMIAEEFGFHITDVTLGADDYSLNSVNGFMTCDNGERFFFKFHHEENEDYLLQEFYKGEILLEAGFPVDMAAHVCRRVGRQILLYSLKTIPKLADAARAVNGAPLSVGDVRRCAAEGSPPAPPPEGLEPVWEHGPLPPLLNPEQLPGTFDPA